MPRIKKFLLYLVLFILLYCIVNGLTYLCMQRKYKDLNYEIDSNSSFMINVEEAKTEYSGGYIKGNITNNSEVLIDLEYVKVDLYKNNIYVGTKYQEIKYFNVGETANFNINYKYTNIDLAKVSLVDKLPEGYSNSESGIGINLNITDKQKKIIIPFAVIFGLWYLLP